MDAELIVWMVFIVIWLISSVLKQVRRFGANRPGQDPSDPRPDVDTTSIPWESEPAPQPMHQRSETRSARSPAAPPGAPPSPPPPPPGRRRDPRPVQSPPPQARPDVPPLLGELMKQLGVEIVQPERPREGHIADQRTASEHEHTPGWHERTASEHEHTPGWHERTESEHRRTLSEHRGTRSEHVLTRSEHSLGEARAKRGGAMAAPSAVPWGARRVVRRHPVVRDLYGRDSLVRAFLAQEILGPPKALQRSSDEGR